jgi:hypothetical protein
VTEEDIEAALDRIDVTVGPTDELKKDEARVEVSGVRHRIFTSTTGPTSVMRSNAYQEVYSTTKSYTVTAETAIFEMHSQTESYEYMLDNKLEGRMYARQWPFFVLKVVLERFAGTVEYWSPVFPVPLTSSFAFDKMLTTLEQEVFLNSANYNLQQAAFGTTDQSYPEMMHAGWMTSRRMEAPVTGPQDAPERGSKPAPPTSREPVLKLTGSRPGSLCAGKPRRRRALPGCLRDLRSLSVYRAEDVTSRFVNSQTRMLIPN